MSDELMWQLIEYMHLMGVGKKGIYVKALRLIFLHASQNPVKGTKQSNTLT